MQELINAMKEGLSPNDLQAMASQFASIGAHDLAALAETIAQYAINERMF